MCEKDSLFIAVCDFENERGKKKENERGHEPRNVGSL